ncbi:MAG: hypothetical protein H6831_15310 [Planctomycetes bacterium]|nr:hypothetical protein [Planctomycetota bacterium]MCB9905766.1 hypothetical protein [Planctomycetota bacterium]
MVPQQPARKLSDALRRMRFRVEEGRFALVGFDAPPVPEDWARLGDGPAQLVREGGETSLLVPERALPELLEAHPEARVEKDLCWIRFETPMGWEVVGFLALVCGSLADAGIPIGAVCGFSRDHLFLNAARLPVALGVLRELFPEGETD